MLRSAIRSTICILAAVAIISIMPAPLLAQPQVDPAPAIEAVTQAAFLEGNWAGEGWIQMGPGPKEEFTQTETVTSMLDGAVLLIEGIGHAKGEDSANKVHHAMALISFDPAQNTLVFSSYVAGRPRLDLVPEVAANTFKWGFSPPGGGEIRYSIVVEDGVWHETGEYSRDGESWNQFFEMHLNKLGTSGRSESSPDRVASPVQAQLERGAAVRFGIVLRRPLPARLHRSRDALRRAGVVERRGDLGGCRLPDRGPGPGPARRPARRRCRGGRPARRWTLRRGARTGRLRAGCRRPVRATREGRTRPGR